MTESDDEKEKAPASEPAQSDAGDGEPDVCRIIASKDIAVDRYREIHAIVRLHSLGDEEHPWPSEATVTVHAVFEGPLDEGGVTCATDEALLGVVTFAPEAAPATTILQIPLDALDARAGQVRLVARPSGVVDRWLRFKLSGALVPRE